MKEVNKSTEPMGCGLAGGIWGIMEGVILDTITVPFYVYEF